MVKRIRCSRASKLPLKSATPPITKSYPVFASKGAMGLMESERFAFSITRSLGTATPFCSSEICLSDKPFIGSLKRALKVEFNGTPRSPTCTLAATTSGLLPSESNAVVKLG